jgi:hypothetical protein
VRGRRESGGGEDGSAVGAINGSERRVRRGKIRRRTAQRPPPPPPLHEAPPPPTTHPIASLTSGSRAGPATVVFGSSRRELEGGAAGEAKGERWGGREPSNRGAGRRRGRERREEGEFGGFFPPARKKEREEF